MLLSVIYFYLTLFNGGSEAWNSFVVVYKNVSFNTNAEYVRLNASIATNRQSFTAHITVLKPFNNFYMDVRMFSTLVHTAEPKMRELFSRSANYCEYVRQKPMPDIILNILHEEFARRSNGFMLKCPVNVGQYAIVDYAVNVAQMPPYLPNAMFRCEVKVYFKEQSQNITIFDMNFDGAVDNDISWRRFKAHGTKQNKALTKV